MVPDPREHIPAFDTKALVGISGGDPEVEADLAREFARSAPGMIGHCRFMLETRNAAGVQHWAHTLKGSGQIFGAEAFVSHCQDLEHLGGQKALDRAAPVLQALEEEWARVREQLTGLWEREKVG